VSDAELRELEQRYQASGALEDEAALLRARLQAGQLSELELRLDAYRGDPAARAALEGAPGLERWEPLRLLIERWYAEPFSAADGNSAEEVAAAEARLGVQFPPVVREWYRLVGRRVRFANQDHPASLGQLKIHNGLLILLWENQGNWAGGVRVEELDQPDPPFEVDLRDVGGELERAPIEVPLLYFLHTETTFCGGQGPLGAWAPEVEGVGPVGGDYGSHYELLLPEESSFYGAVHGDAETLIYDGLGAGIVRTPAARERLERFLV